MTPVPVTSTPATTMKMTPVPVVTPVKMTPVPVVLPVKMTPVSVWPTVSIESRNSGKEDHC